MTWYLKLAGTDKAALLHALSLEPSAPAPVKAELQARIETMFSGTTGDMLAAGDKAVLVFSRGHLEYDDASRPFKGLQDMFIEVQLIALHKAEVSAP